MSLLRSTLAVTVFCSVCAAAFAAGAQPRILSPDPGQTLHDNRGRVPVVVVDIPAGGRLRPLLDGEPASEPVEAAAFELHDVPRGTHRLVVEVLDRDGRPVARSEAVVFHLWRASRLFRKP